MKTHKIYGFEVEINQIFSNIFLEKKKMSLNEAIKKIRKESKKHGIDKEQENLFVSELVKMW